MADSIFIDLCGRLAEPAGPSLTMKLDAPISVAALLAAITTDHPALAAVLAGTRTHFAIDEALVTDSAVIAPGQRLALFPPVSGG